MPKSLDPSGPCGGRYRGCVVCGCHIIRLLTYRQYHYSVVLLLVYSSTIILLLFSITTVLSVLLLSCMYVTMILRYSLESTDDNTVPGHASPAKQAISPAVVATEKLTVKSYCEGPTIDDAPGTPTKRR